MYATVKNVLNNEAYLGNLIQNQTGSLSYKDKTTIRKPETDWICHENAFDAIISPEVWDAVQEINRLAKFRSINNAAPQPHLFTGKLICADCKGQLLANRETQHRKNGDVRKYVSYFCGRYANSGRSACSRHGISEIKLKKLVMAEIKARAEALEFDETAVLDMLKKKMSADDTQRQEDTRQEVGRLHRRIQELEHMTAKLYEDKVSGTISEASFTVLIQKNEQERLQKATRLDTLLSEVRKSEQDAANIQNWAAVIRKHLHLQELDRETVDELIDHIEVGEHTDVNGQRSQNIRVFYRFIGSIET